METIPLSMVEFIFAAFIIIALFSMRADDDHSKSMRMHKLLIWVTLAWLLCDAFVNCFLEVDYWIPFFTVVNILAYVLTNLVLMVFLDYCYSYLVERTTVQRWPFVLSRCVLIADAVLDVIWCIQGKLFTYSNGRFVFDTPSEFVVVLGSYLVILFIPALMSHYRKEEVGKRAVVLLTLYGVPTLVAILMLALLGTDFSVVLSAFSVIVSSRLLQADLKEKRLIESKTFTDFFLESYSSAYYVNLKDYSCQTYKQNRFLKENYPIATNYWNSLNDYIENCVHPDDKAGLLEVIRPDGMQDILEKNREYTYVFRDISSNEERYLRMQVIRGSDDKHAAFGFEDISEEIREQQKRLLGAIPISPNILSNADIGMWALEMDEGQPTRLYGDETMLRLIGVEHQVSPEETFHALYDHIDKDSYALVAESVEKMKVGHSEVQFPWHRPNGETIVVRCGGMRNAEYAKGIRIEGTHQNVTEVVHFDEQEVTRLKNAEVELRHEQLRSEVLSFMMNHDDDPIELLKNYIDRLIDIIGCDQVIYRDLVETRIMTNSKAFEENWTVPIEYCRQCPHFDAHHPVYSEGFTEMANCQEGWKGVPIFEKCPVKSALTRIVYCDGEVAGYLAFHFIRDYHQFTDVERKTLEEFTRILSISLSRYQARKENKELKIIKEMQEQLQEALQMADSANKAKTEFLFNMSHDIRTPMNAILGFTDIALHHEDDTERVHDSLTKIKTSGGHLLSLINEILEMSRIEAGKLELVETPTDLLEVAEDITQMSKDMAITKSISFEKKVGDIKNPYVFADELHLNQIMLNLISNAVKYTQNGGNVTYSVEQLGEPENGVARYRFSVRDNGIGMSEEFQKHLFENFSRENSTTVSRQEGTGIGLSIVKRITEMAGGTIQVVSRKGEGSMFSVEFPFRVMNEVEMERFREEKASHYTVKKEESLEGKRVLIVEDNAMNREIISDILQDFGMEMDSAEDGVDAVKLVKKNGTGYYDFILMDIQMPVMNGYEATAEIRALPEGEKIAIIALSANAFKEDMDKSMAAGMNAHVAKPIDVEILLATMNSLLN